MLPSTRGVAIAFFCGFLYTEGYAYLHGGGDQVCCIVSTWVGECLRSAEACMKPGRARGRACGWRFDVRAFIGAQRRSAREFLSAMRHSQLFEVFVRERLLLASRGYPAACTFEGKARPRGVLQAARVQAMRPRPRKHVSFRAQCVPASHARL